MKITIYKLLGLVKDDKAPQKIKYEYSIYELIPERNNYYCKNDMRWFTNEINSLEVLNNEVEIIEEPKEIKKLPKEITDNACAIGFATFKCCTYFVKRDCKNSGGTYINNKCIYEQKTVV